MHKVSSDFFNELLVKYSNDSHDDLLLQPLEKSSGCKLEVAQAIRQNLYIQSALSEMLFINNKQANISIPLSVFDPEEYCTVFQKVVLYTITRGVVTFSVKEPEQRAIQFMEDDKSSDYLHPLLQKGLSYFQRHGKLATNADLVFMTYDAKRNSYSHDDLLIASANAWKQTGFIGLPVYMSQTELEEDCLLAEYNGYFDDMILVGHMEEEFICHAMVCCFEKPYMFYLDGVPAEL